MTSIQHACTPPQRHALVGSLAYCILYMKLTAELVRGYELMCSHQTAVAALRLPQLDQNDKSLDVPMAIGYMHCWRYRMILSIYVDLALVGVSDIYMRAPG
jgi:hypothetical protein